MLTGKQAFSQSRWARFPSDFVDVLDHSLFYLWHGLLHFQVGVWVKFIQFSGVYLAGAFFPLHEILNWLEVVLAGVLGQFSIYLHTVYRSILYSNLSWTFIGWYLFGWDRSYLLDYCLFTNRSPVLKFASHGGLRILGFQLEMEIVFEVLRSI